MMNVYGVIKRADALYDRIPTREITSKTAAMYRATFVRMWNSGHLNPWQPGIAGNTCYRRCAIFYFGARELLMGATIQCVSAADCGDLATAQRWARKLLRAIERIEPILTLEKRA